MSQKCFEGDRPNTISLHVANQATWIGQCAVRVDKSEISCFRPVGSKSRSIMYLGGRFCAHYRLQGRSQVNHKWVLQLHLSLFHTGRGLLDSIAVVRTRRASSCKNPSGSQTNLRSQVPLHNYA